MADMEDEDRKRERAELAARVAGAALQHGLGADVNENTLDPTLVSRHDSVAKEVAEVAMKKGLVKGEDLAPVSFATLNAVALAAASAAIQKGVARDETEPEITEEQKYHLQELSILAASSAVQHHLGEEAIDSTVLKQVTPLAEAAAEAAIQRKLVPDERHDPTLKDLAEMARQAAGAAIQKHLAVEDREMKNKEHDSERQKLASMAAAAALKKTPSIKPPTDVDETDYRHARETTQFAIEHQLIDHPEPPSELVAEVARMAAAAAIQRGLADEVMVEQRQTERKEFLAAVARDAASFAIQRGLGAEVVPNRRRGYELAVLAASAAVRRQEHLAEERVRVEPAQIAEVARHAAQEAVRLGYGHDEADLMVMPKTPPLADNISGTDIVKTDLMDKEQTADTRTGEDVVYREAQIEEPPKGTIRSWFRRIFRVKSSPA